MKKGNLNEEVWDKKNIERAIKGIITAKEKKTRLVHWLDRNLIWIIILLAIIGSLFVAFGFLPLLILLSGPKSYFAVAFIGIVIGSFFEFLISDLESVERHQHLAIMLIIPLVSIMNFLFMFWGIQKYMLALQFNFIFAGIVYAGFFLLPYAVYEFVVRRK